MAEEKKTVKKAPKAETVEEKKAPKAKAPAKKAAKAEVVEEPKEAKKEAKKASKKAPVEEKPSRHEASAFARDVRITPRKVRLVADLDRGKSLKDALGILAGCNRVAKTPVEKVIRSAAANAINNFGMKEENLYIAEIQVGDGLKIKRFIPRAKGSASGIIKRNAHISVTVKERN